jgi:hypothetical protein
MMVVLLLLIGFIAVAAGMFGLGLGVPVKDTTFGGAVLVSSTVAITGGFILVGLALAVSELRRALHAGIRQVRPPERFDAERGHGARRMEPRLGGGPGALDGVPGGPSGADAVEVISTRFDAPKAEERSRKPAREEWAPEAPRAERFGAIRPSEYRKPDTSDAEGAPTPQAQAQLAAATGAGDVKSPPLSPADAAGPAAVRPLRVLKSGMINDVAYTLFSDGSIETQTTAGALRFGSIDEFRKHLEKTG